MLRGLAKLLALLNSETDPVQISLAFCLAMVGGFTPVLSLHNVVVLLLVLVLRANLSAFILAWAVFSGLAFALDPAFHSIGLAILTAPALESLFTGLYNSTLWRLENFNNSIVMGSLVVSLVSFVPMLLLGNMLIRRYRETFLRWVEKSRLMVFFKASKFYGIYAKVAGAGGLG